MLELGTFSVGVYGVVSICAFCIAHRGMDAFERHQVGYVTAPASVEIQENALKTLLNLGLGQSNQVRAVSSPQGTFLRSVDGISRYTHAPVTPVRLRE